MCHSCSRSKTRLEHIDRLGVDAIVVIPFCMRLAEMAPQRFLDDVLLQCTRADSRSSSVEDFRFGQHAQVGRSATLKAFGTKHGFAVVAHELVERDGEPVTSTRIRTLIAQGDVESACTLLGRPHHIPGRVVHGRGEGESLLGATHGERPAVESRSPTCRWRVLQVGSGSTERTYPAAISIGVPPMYPKALDKVEAHLIGFEGDLYGREVILEFETRLREQPNVRLDRGTGRAPSRPTSSRVDELASGPASTCGSEADND